MKTPDDKTLKDTNELREHYDFDYTRGKPNRFAKELGSEAIMVVLEPEVAAAFPTPEAVNEALRLVMRLSKIPTAPPRKLRKQKVAGA